MNQTDYTVLRNITQGDFAIKDGILFYNNRELSSQNRLILHSCEEAFFMFPVNDKGVGFKQVFLLNCNYPHFYTSIKYKIETTRFQFISPPDIKHAFRLISYQGSPLSTKIVGDDYFDDYDWRRLF